jgi:hypothetical protein
MLSPIYYKNMLAACKFVRESTGDLHSAVGTIDAAAIFDTAVYKPEHFRIDEIVDPATFATYGEKSLWFMDSRILWTADAIREYFNKPCIVNNYNIAKPGEYVYRDSGLRLEPVGAATRSQHIYGRALDIKIQGVLAGDARMEIKSKWKAEPAFRFITAIEDGVNWLHIDCRNTNSDQLLIFTKE